MNKIKTAIIGASGYTGVELVRILHNHKSCEIVALTAHSNSGQNIQDIYPHLNHLNLPKLCTIEEVNFEKINFAFLCLPHATSQEIIKELAVKYPKLKIIDLSADFRLENIKEYKKWYNNDHLAPELQKKAVYGLSEFNRNNIKSSQLVACPGCYPTSILLPLIALLENSLIDANSIISDSKSGISGAGRSLKQELLFCETSHSFKAYSIGGHRHIGEIEQELSKVSNQEVQIEFTPHLIPINRGILSTIYVDLNDSFSIDDVKNCLKTRFEDEYFVNIVENAKISDVISTNFCNISIHKAHKNNKVIITSVIDNLCKGASGQAVQNMNIMSGIDERSGLEFSAVFP